MFFNNNTYKVIKIFLEDPLDKFGLRELSRKTSISTTAIKRHLKILEKEKLIVRKIEKSNVFYKANRENEKFSLQQKITTLYELENYGIIDYLWEKTCPETIILFGSHAKGEAINDSDIDLFIIGKQIKIDVSSYEKKLGKELHIFFEKDIKNIPKELKNNLINGIVLKGYFKLI